MNYNVARIELEQQRKQLANERLSCAAEYRVQKLDLDMFGKSLGEIKRTLEDAKIRAPAQGDSDIHQQSDRFADYAGQQVAVISDLSPLNQRRIATLTATASPWAARRR